MLKHQSVEEYKKGIEELKSVGLEVYAKNGCQISIRKNSDKICFFNDTRIEELYKASKNAVWMITFCDKSFADRMCKAAIEEGVVVEASYENKNKGVCRFFLNMDDNGAQRKSLEAFLKTNFADELKSSKAKYGVVDVHLGLYLPVEEYRKHVKLMNIWAGSLDEYNKNGYHLSIRKEPDWIYYINESRIEELYRTDNIGKWMYFFNDREFANKICQTAVEEGAVVEAKYSNKEDEGVCCFYVNADNENPHKKILTFFLENELVRRTKTGRLYNISFKFDEQTRNSEYKYNDNFSSDIRLGNFVDLETGEWIGNI